MAKGSNIHLTCRYNPSPPVSKVQWIKDGTMIAQNASVVINDPRVKINHYNGSQTQLSITAATARDAGNYNCSVTYGIGSSWETRLIVVGGECV